MSEFCGVCHDNRAVEWTANRRAYPCPYCGQFTNDPKKKISDEQRRYGNPFILGDGDYEKFKARRRLDDFAPFPSSVNDLKPEERARFRSIASTYQAAHEKFCLVWARYGQ